MEIAGLPAFTGPAPWGGNHDLLVNEDHRTLAGIVSPVAIAERSAVLRICAPIQGRLVRYCVSPRFAAELLKHDAIDATALPRDWGDPNLLVQAFPQLLRPIR